MFKTYFFLEGPAVGECFRFTGAEAAAAVLEVMPELAGFTQTRTLSEQVDPSTPPRFVGVAECWFADPAVALASEAAARALAGLTSPDVRVGAVVTGEARTVMRLPAHYEGTFIKGVFPFRRRADLSVSAFQRYWWHEHAPIAARTENAAYYLQVHPLSASYETGRPPYDGITELHWRDVASARTAMGSRQMREDQAGDAENFAEPGSVLLFLAREEVVIPA